MADIEVLPHAPALNIVEKVPDGSLPPEFGEDVARAAEGRMGNPVMNHKEEAGCGFGPTIDACMEVGLGPKQFDCSGLAIASLCDAFGLPVTAWPRQWRHVRDMYRPDTAETDLSRLQRGHLIVYGRFYDVAEGVTRLSPAHIGVVVRPDVQSNNIRMIHAAQGRVSNGWAPLRVTHERLMGVIDPAVLVSHALGRLCAA